MGGASSRPRPGAPAPAPPPHAAAPPSLRQFTDDELFAATAGFARRRALGEGGFGRVYGGELQDGTRIAVKLLDRTGLQGEAEWRNEIDVLSRLPPHPSIVSLIGSCADGRVRGAVLAAVDGPCVRDALAATAATAAAPASFPWRARLAAAAGAAEGLAHAHAHGVAHGDVSSANLLACAARGGVLCDFGLARPAGGPPAERVGQPAYVGPEAALPLPLPPSATAAAADVHALGVVLCELLTGLAPHAARGAPLHDWPSLVAALDARLFDAAGAGPPADQVAALAEAAAGCLAAAPGDRPDAGAVAAYVRKAARSAGGAPVSRPLAARPVTPAAAPAVPPLVEFEGGGGAAAGGTPRARAALEAAVAAAPLVCAREAGAEGGGGGGGNPFA